MAAMAERLELACCARWRRRNEKWYDELVGQACGGVHIVTGRARTPTARGNVVSRPATGGAMRHTFSKNGDHCSLTETLIQCSITRLTGDV